MGEPKNLGMAAAVAGGYLLGRGKKGQMALTAAALLAGRGLRPGSLVADGVRKVPGVPASLKGGGDDEGGTAPESGHGTGSGAHAHGRLSRAARGVANHGITALTGALHERTLGLNDESADDGESAAPEAGDGSDGNGGNADDDTAVEDEAAGEAEPPEPKPAAKKAVPKKRVAPKKRAAPKKPAAAKAPSGKPGGKKPSPARKTTAKKSRPTKKATPHARRER
ncbi:hypothetical protein [Streptomyces sp. NBC_00448]|uniref:hypothetical protein n=1 Tax=Streptomyces sp. NBC_00448 TaxID=2903652 RepID=UPI002E1BCDFC